VLDSWLHIHTGIHFYI